jgi:plasmid stabilization system protein ParE
LTAYTARAAQQIKDLLQHYETRERPEAVRALDAAMIAAERLIDSRQAEGLPAPRPYPSIARPGWRWIKSGRYWVGYTVTTPPLIAAVFYDAADIPSRL